MASLEQWIKDFPVITRTYMAGALLTTAACALELLSPYSLYFSLPLIVGRHQYWRLVTNFFFFGRNFTLDFLFHMFFLSASLTQHRLHAAYHVLRTSRSLPSHSPSLIAEEAEG